jgi:hypothetical protein
LRLFAADELLESGVTPQALLKAQGFDPAPLSLLKYNRDPPRVPAGNGRESGRRTSDGAGGSEGIDGNIILVSGGPHDNDKERSYEEQRARGQNSPKEDIEHGHGIPLYPEGPLAPPPPSAGAREPARPRPKPSDFVGQDFGKLGVGEQKPELSIQGFFDHAVEGMAEREVPLEDIQDIVSNPLIVLKQSRGRHYYLSEKAAVVLDREGKVITVYPASHFDANIRKILRYVLGGTME